jgi:hypothetical protein
MRRTRIAALTAAGALAAAGTGVAVATTTDDPKEREEAVLADAAKRLDVAPSELRDALQDAERAQLEEDVKAGRLTDEQADAIARHRPLLGGPRFHGGPEMGLHLKHPGGGPIELFSTAAETLGIEREELADRLHDGETLGEIAKAEGKSLDAVRKAVRDKLKERFDKAVEDGHLTREQADAMLERSSELVEHLGEFPRPPRPPRWR